MRSWVFTAAFLATVSAAGQANAVRMILGEGHKVYTNPSFGNYCMGLGYDRTFNDKLTIGVDVAFDISNITRDQGISFQQPVPGNTYSSNTYIVDPRMLSVNYHTEFALGDNSATHGYIGTYIGLRRLKQQWAMTLVDRYDNYYTEERMAKRLLVPVGLRLGLRGATDGNFMDLYVAAGYQIGGGHEMEKLAPVDMRFTKTSSLAVSFGFAYGFGW